MLAERSYRLLSLLMLEVMIVSKVPQPCLVLFLGRCGKVLSYSTNKIVGSEEAEFWIRRLVLHIRSQTKIMFWSISEDRCVQKHINEEKHYVRAIRTDCKPVIEISE